jgi:ABC-type transport system involved in multi-copper enzyme maturation permease subunit
MLAKLPYFLFTLGILALAIEVAVRYPDNHASGVWGYAVYFSCILLLALYLSIFKSREWVFLLAASVALLLVVYACDRWNIMVSYETWIERGMPSFGQWTDKR